MDNKYIVITSIQPLTEAIKCFAKLEGWRVIVVGDQKSPSLPKIPYPNVRYLSLKEQLSLGFEICKVLPYNHYARKNVGYLYAIKQGASCIADVDDDNIPYENWGQGVKKRVSSIELIRKPEIVNIYTLFTDQLIWPRGFPLNHIARNEVVEIVNSQDENIGIWQGLVDNDPDVDAIYRLIFGHKEVKFNRREPIALAEGVYCPFNSQNTIWFKESFFYLYLPIHVTFRFTDILRSYIAQRGLHAMGWKIAFTSATAYQKRNPHDLMADFVDEIPCYTQVMRVIDIIKKIDLVGDPIRDLYVLYRNLYTSGIVSEKELIGVEAWIKDMLSLL
jgi:hypothetical protein